MTVRVAATTAGRKPRNPGGDHPQAAGVILDRLGAAGVQAPELAEKFADRDVDLPGRLRRLETAERLVPAIGNQRLIDRPGLRRGLILVCGPKLETFTPPTMSNPHRIVRIRIVRPWRSSPCRGAPASSGHRSSYVLNSYTKALRPNCGHFLCSSKHEFAALCNKGASGAPLFEPCYRPLYAAFACSSLHCH